ncbi:GNAT family N-acetyltransferase [Streptomyces sp. NPDC002225]|uniref:GNAT family N-acetyltransferase n=1 Tax=Streptomyces sp. NPDC002225 TaxID=3154413 RepID=UPI0033167D17
MTASSAVPAELPDATPSSDSPDSPDSPDNAAPVESPADPKTFVRTAFDLGDVVLRPWTRADAGSEAVLDALVTAAADPMVALWNPIRATDRDAARTWVEARDDGWEKGTAASFAILDATDGAVLGSATLRWADRADGLAMIGYLLLPAARGRGVVTRAVTAITDWGFDTADVRRVEIAHAVGNAASCGVADRCGYLFEGVLRESYRFGDGEYHDEHLHARLAKDPRP